jgi:hypothetical protein
MPTEPASIDPDSTLVDSRISAIECRPFANRIVEVMMLLRIFGSLAALAVVVAAGFYFYTAGDRTACDQACVVESGEEP